MTTVSVALKQSRYVLGRVRVDGVLHMAACKRGSVVCAWYSIYACEYTAVNFSPTGIRQYHCIIACICIALKHLKQ